MFVRNMWSRRYFDQDTGGGTGGNPDNANGGTSTANNQQQQNNTSTNEENFATLWDQPEDKTQQQQTQQQNNSQQQPQTARSPAEQLQEHYKQTIGDIKFDAEKIGRELQEGNMETLEGAMNGFGQKMYQTMMANMGQYVNGKVQQAVAEAVQQATGNVNSSMVVSKMNDQLKFTANPAIAPMAKAVLNQLLQKGKSPDEAIAGVKAYYAQIANTVNGNSGNRRPGTGNYNNGHSQNSVNDGTDPEEIDWMAALSANPQ